MSANVGSIDRVLRVIVGLGLVSLLFLVEGNMRWIGLLGFVMLGSALLGYCPAYSLLGINTCGLRRKSA